MIKKNFRHDFLRGLGSALYELKTCESTKQYYDVVRYACLHNTTYDMQCEGNRGWYLYQAAQVVGGNTIIKDIISIYAGTLADYWLFSQLTSILFHYSVNGNDSARFALYDKYRVLLDSLSHFSPSKPSALNEYDMFDCVSAFG